MVSLTRCSKSGRYSVAWIRFEYTENQRKMFMWSWFLSQEKDLWAKFSKSVYEFKKAEGDGALNDCLNEVSQNLLSSVKDNLNGVIDMKRYGNVHKLFRVTCDVLCFIGNLKFKRNDRVSIVNN